MNILLLKSQRTKQSYKEIEQNKYLTYCAIAGF